MELPTLKDLRDVVRPTHCTCKPHPCWTTVADMCSHCITKLAEKHRLERKAT